MTTKRQKMQEIFVSSTFILDKITEYSKSNFA